MPDYTQRELDALGTAPGICRAIDPVLVANNVCDLGEPSHRAHLAEQLQPLIRQAQAEALREAAEAMPFGYSHAAFMLRERADLLAGDA